MLANNTNKMVWVGIALGLVGVLGGSLMMIYPDAYDITRTAIVKEMSGFTGKSTDATVNVAQYAQKTINAYVPYAIVPGKGILTPRHDMTSFGDDYNHGYSMKDSSFIKDKYHVHDDPDVGIYSDYSLDGTNNRTDGDGKTISQVGFYDQPDVAPLLQNGKLTNVKIAKSVDDYNNGNYAFYNTPAATTSMWVTNISNNTGRQGSLDLDKKIFYDIDNNSGYDNSYTFGQDGVVEKTTDFIKNNHVSNVGVLGSWQMPAGSILDGWSEDDYNNTNVPKDSSIDGFYVLDSDYGHNPGKSYPELAPLIKKYNIQNDAYLQYVGKLHINFHFVDVGYDTTTN